MIIIVVEIERKVIIICKKNCINGKMGVFLMFMFLHSVQLVGYVSFRVCNGSGSVSSGPSYTGHFGL